MRNENMSKSLLTTYHITNTMVTADFRPEAVLTLFLCIRAKEIAKSLGKCVPIGELFPYYRKSRSLESF